jgi:transcription elongation factor Elf1
MAKDLKYVIHCPLCGNKVAVKLERECLPATKSLCLAASKEEVDMEIRNYESRKECAKCGATIQMDVMITAVKDKAGNGRV